MCAARLTANEVGLETASRQRVGIPGRVGRSIVSGHMKASSTGSSGTSILSRTQSCQRRSLELLQGVCLILKDLIFDLIFQMISHNLSYDLM
jgi:hypothetical protein